MSSLRARNILSQYPAFKTIAAVTLVAFLNLTLQPVALAKVLSTPGKKPAVVKAKELSDEAKLAGTIEKIEKKLQRLEAKLTKKLDAAQEKSDLKKLQNDLIVLDKKAIEGFAKIEQHLKKKKLPKVIHDRHAQAVSQYRKEMATLKANLEGVESADTDKARRLKVKKAREHLKKKQKKRARQEFDPNDLPHKSLKPNPKNKPKKSKEEYLRAGLYDNPLVQLAALGNFTFDQLPDASNPAYLAQTVEVVLSDAIKAKAAELGHDPIDIYDWVRNNVEWLPTWGASQDADVTLGSLRGNAVDIASLVIALLRASGIPARYVHGTIEVSPEKFMNWAGGFSDINAAMNFAASGSVPITQIVSGGVVKAVQLEHVWVEAAIDFQPSRGAINKSADTWVPLDPSFKQYEFLQGLDVIGISGVEPIALRQSFINSGTVNESESWVSDMDPTILENAQTQVRITLEAYIKNSLANPTVGDVIGGRKTIVKTQTVLPAALPNRLVVTGARYAAVPQSLQNAMVLAMGRDLLGELRHAVGFAWPMVNNHKLTLSFRPATAADEQTLLSLLPEGEITDPSQLPSSIPSYLVNVVPQFALDGEVVQEGDAMRLGEDFTIVFQPRRIGQPVDTKTYTVPAGSYLSLAAMSGSVSQQILQDLDIRLGQTRSTLQSGDASLIGTLTREDVMGDMFYASTLGYFGQYLAIGQMAALGQNAHHELGVGFGSVGYEPSVDTFFGFPRAITPGGTGVNVWVGAINEMGDGIRDRKANFSFQMGMLSSVLEHAVLEQMFSTPDSYAEGVSAVKALQLAQHQGQRIYHITKANQATTLPNIHQDSLTMTEIQQGLHAGKEVIVHTNPISVPGFTGAGYIIFDPSNGSGAYKITGGSNGGFFSGLAFGLMLFAMLAIAFITGGIAGLIVALILIGQIALPIYVMHMSVYGADEELKNCWLAGFTIGLGIGGLLAALGEVGVLNALGVAGAEWLVGSIDGTFDSARSCF